MSKDKRLEEVHKHIGRSLDDVNKNLHLSHKIGHALHKLSTHSHKSSQKKCKRTSLKFASDTTPLMHSALDHLEDLSFHIDRLADHYQAFLHLSDLDLESHVQTEHKMRAHLISLRNLHDKQKETLGKVASMFVNLSRKQLRDETAREIR